MKVGDKFILHSSNGLDYNCNNCSDDCVTRASVKDGMIKYGFHAPDMTVTEFVEDELPPAIPTLPKGTTNGNILIKAFPNLKYTIQNDRVVTTIGVASSFDLEWWNEPYERGNENGSN